MSGSVSFRALLGLAGDIDARRFDRRQTALGGS